MYYPLRNPLTVKVRHLVQEGVVLQQDRPAGSHSQRGRLAVDRVAMAGGEDVRHLRKNIEHAHREYDSSDRLNKWTESKHAERSALKGHQNIL